MTLQEISELVRLLNIYQMEMLEQNQKNIEESKRNRRWEIGSELVYGVKAQYNHARCITRKLSVEIGKELKSNWEL